MRPQTIPVLSTILLASLAAADTADSYIQSVCQPDVTPAPPCQAIINIESACQPNGTEPLDYLAHAECMCNGGFFPNWLGCLDCYYVHGNRSSGNVAAFNTILSSASNALCTGTPTARFADIFANISNSNGPQDGSVTSLKDQFPSQTAVSLYYTASGPQGVGAITGSATLATKTGAENTAASTGSDSSKSTGTSGTDGTAGGSSANPAATTSSSSAGAAATQIIGGLLAVVAGGVIVAL